MAELQSLGAIVLFHLMLIASIIVMILKNNMLSKRRTIDIIIVCAINAVAVVLEFAFEYFFHEKMLDPDALELLYPSTQIAFAAITFMFFRITSKEKKLFLLILVPVAETILLYVSHFTGIGIYISDSYEIEARFVTYLVMAINMVFYGAQILYSIIINKRQQNNSYYVYGLMSLVLIVGRLIQLYHKSTRVFLVSVSFTVILYAIFQAKRAKETDEITKLLNRDSFEIRLNKVQTGSVIMVFDIDYFKVVNDENGHDYGDYCLEKIGKIFVAAFSKNGRCYRIGGDEFVVILDKKVDFIKSMIQSFDDMVDYERKNDPHFPTISMGYFIVEDTDAEKCFRIADEKMYEVKNAKKARDAAAKEAEASNA